MKMDRGLSLQNLRKFRVDIIKITTLGLKLQKYTKLWSQNYQFICLCVIHAIGHVSFVKSYQTEVNREL